MGHSSYRLYNNRRGLQVAHWFPVPAAPGSALQKT